MAALVTVAAFAVATWVSGFFLFTRLLPSPDTRWPVAFAIGAAAAAFTGLWGQSWATESCGPGSRFVPVEQLAPHEQRERKARDHLRQYLGRQERLRRMDQTSALALGIHPAIDLPRPRRGRSIHVQTLDRNLPAFVDRDRGPEITSWMYRAREDGGFLVLVGDSSVGKTRLLYEMARDVLPDFAVLAPDLGNGDLVNSIAEATFPLPKLIVWLDELQRFLDGPYLTPGSTPITDATVRHLLDTPTPVVLLGAMWPQHASQLRATEPAPHTSSQRLRYPRAADILANRRVHQETLTSFSGTEREAAVKLSSNDPRLAKALADRHYNVTEVLAGAPQLVARYEQASEEQRAVLNAAIDARHLGIQGPLTDTLLRAAARGYLSTLHHDDTWLLPALTELTRHDRPQDHATAPLIPLLNEEKSKILGYTVADYLLQRLTRQRRSTRLSAVTWQALIDHTHDDHDLARLAVGADRRLLYGYAEPLYRQFASADDTYAAHRLADLLVKRNGPAEEITAAFQILIEAGRSYDENIWVVDATCRSIVERLDERGRDDVATAVRRAWADAGNKAAAGDWAKTLVRQNRIEQAVTISRTMVDIGQEFIVESWFERLLTQDKIDQAMIVLRAFIDVGGIRASRYGDSLDDWLESNWPPSLYPGDTSGGRKHVVEGWFDRLAKKDRGGDAVAILRAVADADGRRSARTLAYLLAEQGNIEELRARADAVEYERRGQPDDWFSNRLAYLLAEQGNIEELRARADNGNKYAYAARRLVDLLVDQGCLDELRDRAGNGNRYAACRLVDLLVKQGHLDEAITIARTLAANDGWLVMNLLCPLLQRQGNIQEVISLRRAQADAGDKWAAADWAKLLIEQDCGDEATRIAMALAETHQKWIASQWCLRLAEQGRTDEELTVLRVLTDVGDSWAADRLVDRLIALNRAVEALDVLRARADDDRCGDDVTYRLAELLVQQGCLDELRDRADNGDINAAGRLANLLAERGCLDELRDRADNDDKWAAGDWLTCWPSGAAWTSYGTAPMRTMIRRPADWLTCWPSGAAWTSYGTAPMRATSGPRRNSPLFCWRRAASRSYGMRSTQAPMMPASPSSAC